MFGHFDMGLTMFQDGAKSPIEEQKVTNLTPRLTVCLRCAGPSPSGTHAHERASLAGNVSHATSVPYAQYPLAAQSTHTAQSILPLYTSAHQHQLYCAASTRTVHISRSSRAAADVVKPTLTLTGRIRGIL